MGLVTGQSFVALPFRQQFTIVIFLVGDVQSSPAGESARFVESLANLEVAIERATLRYAEYLARAVISIQHGTQVHLQIGNVPEVAVIDSMIARYLLQDVV
jgi:hypothetical protein